MKTKISILLCAVLSLASPGLYAATHVVLPGQSIQAAITSASPGDQIIIKGGTYVGENITINKNLDIRREQNASVSITGSITFTGLSQLQSFARDNLVNIPGWPTPSDCAISGESERYENRIYYFNNGGHLPGHRGGDGDGAVL